MSWTCFHFLVNGPQVGHCKVANRADIMLTASHFGPSDVNPRTFLSRKWPFERAFFQLSCCLSAYMMCMYIWCGVCVCVFNVFWVGASAPRVQYVYPHADVSQYSWTGNDYINDSIVSYQFCFWGQNSSNQHKIMNIKWPVKKAQNILVKPLIDLQTNLKRCARKFVLKENCPIHSLWSLTFLYKLST